MKLAVKYPSLGDISKQDMISILDAFELVDIERLVGICNKSFFKEKKELSHEEFKRFTMDAKGKWDKSELGEEQRCEGYAKEIGLHSECDDF